MNPPDEDNIPAFQIPILGIMLLLIVAVSIVRRNNEGKLPQMK
jgi:hypothetical protein